MNNRFKSLLILLTAIQINFACKKESSLVRIDIESSRGYVLVNESLARTPTTFYWPIGSKYHISSLGAWTGDWVEVIIYRESNKELTQNNRGKVDFIYEVQP
jgi:hypothetical protein